jgi:hypothetical protein
MYLIDSGIKEIDKVKKLNIVEFYLSALIIISQLLLDEISFGTAIVFSFFILAVFKYKQQTTTELRYTFWGILFFQSLMMLVTFVNAQTNLTNFLSVVILFLVSFEAYTMMSPIFYPRIKWWEWDFRYRGDTQVKVKNGEDSFEARLSDLRRDAGAITLFEDISYNEEIFIEINFMNELLSFKAKIISKRESNLGRGITYGVSFIFDEDSQKQRFGRYKNFWSMNNKIKLRNKFRGK